MESSSKPTSTHSTSIDSKAEVFAGEDASVEKHDTTAFIDVQPPVTSETSHSQHGQLIVGSVTDKGHSIAEYLARAVRVQQLNMGGKAEFTILAAMDPMRILKDEPQANTWRHKLRGSLGLTATAVFRVNINPQPMCRGALAMSFVPFFNGNTTDFPVKLAVGSTGKNIARFLSGCQSSYLNVGSGTSMELRVPYVGYRPLLDLSDSTVANWGTCFVWSLQNISDSTNLPCCPSSLYMSLDDVKLYATSRDQSSLGYPQSNQREVNAQGGSFVEHLTSMALNAVVEEVPEIGEVVSALPWISEVAELGLAFAGLSKPTQTAPTTTLKQRCAPDMANTDGVSMAQPLAAMKKNQVSLSPLGPTTQDEMNIKYVTQRKCLLDNFRWIKTDTPGKILYETPIEPHLSIDLTNGGVPTLFDYVSSFFEMWRGGIDYEALLGANSFYSGRLRYMIAYNDGSMSRAPNINTEDVNYTYWKVVDLRNANTESIPCPYIHTTPWKLRNSQNTDTKHLGQAWLYIAVETPLCAPDAAPSDISISLFKFAGPDYELSVPCLPRYRVVRGDPQSKPWLTRSPKGGRTSHENDWDAGFQQSSDFTLLGSLSRQALAAPADLCVGERFTSLRPLLRKYFLTQHAAGTESGTSKLTYIYPFLETEVLLSEAKNRQSVYYRSMLRYLRPIYRFYRGGKRFIFTSDNDNSLIAKTFFITSADAIERDTTTGWHGEKNVWDAKPTTIATASNFAAFQDYSSVQHFSLNQEGVVEFSVPFHSLYPQCFNTVTPFTVAPNILDQYNNWSMRAGQNPMGFVALIHRARAEDSKDSNETLLYEAPSDDFNMGYLIGAPWVVDTFSEGGE